MAYLYKRTGSPYWWICYVNARGQRVRESTMYRVASAGEHRKAKELLRERRIEEMQRQGVWLAGGRWEKWVEDFTARRYADSPKSLLRYRKAWDHLAAFLTERKATCPAHVDYQLCLDYLAWREGQGSHPNTALVELKFLGVVMGEAVRRGFARGNPVLKLGVKRRKAQEKPDIPDDHLAIILAELEGQPQWMRDCVAIGMATGLRLSECNLAMPDVDLANRSITIRSPKGGAERGFSIPYDDALAPLLARLKAARPQQTAWDWPPSPAKMLWTFFRKCSEKHGLPHYSFHCLRVTFITRGARRGVPQAVMMKLVNHASAAVHRIYQRLSLGDTRQYLAQLRAGMARTVTPQADTDGKQQP